MATGFNMSSPFKLRRKTKEKRWSLCICFPIALGKNSICRLQLIFSKYRPNMMGLQNWGQVKKREIFFSAPSKFRSLVICPEPIFNCWIKEGGARSSLTGLHTNFVKQKKCNQHWKKPYQLGLVVIFIKVALFKTSFNFMWTGMNSTICIELIQLIILLSVKLPCHVLVLLVEVHYM